VQCIEGSVTSHDGTVVGFRQVGAGPAVVLIHGGMQASQNLMKLAAALSDSFTVYVPDRRGRGRSGPHGNDYGIGREVEDCAALLVRTGARNVFGLSAGALIALRAGLELPAIRKLALYEPPFPVGATSPTAWVTRYESELARGDLAAAMVSVIKGTADPIGVARLPRFMLVALLRLAIPQQARQVRPPEVALQTLIPTMHYDARLPPAFEGTLQQYKLLRAEVLLLGGSKSRDYLKAALDALERVLPRAQRVEFSGVGHLAADNDGKPERVAETLLRFFD